MANNILIIVDNTIKVIAPILAGGAIALLTSFMNHHFSLKQQYINFIKQKELNTIFDFREKLLEFYFTLSWQGELFSSMTIRDIANAQKASEEAKKIHEKLDSKNFEFIQSYEIAKPYLNLNKKEFEIVDKFCDGLLVLKTEIVCEIEDELSKKAGKGNFSGLNAENKFSEIEKNYKTVKSIIDKKIKGL